MAEQKLNTVYLKDYQPPAYEVQTVDLKIELSKPDTKVTSTLKLQKCQESESNAPLVLLGDNLTLHSLKLNDELLSASDYQLTETELVIPKVPEQFTLQVVTHIRPQENTALSGLYQSNGMYCTQCEAEGFRRITFYPDRPDVMAKFTTTICADKAEYPVLLANGNLIDSGDLETGRHFATWEDPFKKPSYLFAMVAGSLMAVEDHFLTQSGRLVTLKLYVERENLDKTRHAMEALKKSMAWDEQTYGREYDLDIYMIVAVNDFNMGAMENKGLNIFNSKYVLARPETATDLDFEAIDAVVGHEYFHNWSGNRVTCRDWFQLSLKEGFTVFREQNFSRDVSQSPTTRIDQVRLLRTRQFAEDAGPMAHPIRPDSYVEINNFYTLTVYEKGSEVIRMLNTLLGKETFRKGTDLYFERHDGQAVTTDHFVQAMSDASGVDLTQFKLWYSQAGTPEVTVKESYDESTKSYELTLTQYCPPTPGQTNKSPLLLPIAIGLLKSNGEDLLFRLADTDTNKQTTCVLHFKEQQQTFKFTDIPEKPVLSFLRNFSAPVKVKTELSNDQLAFLLAHDSDGFNRWDSGQQLFERAVLDLVKQVQAKQSLTLQSEVLPAIKNVLEDDTMNAALKAEILTLPATSHFIEVMDVADPEAIQTARTFLKRTLVSELERLFLKVMQGNQSQGNYRYEATEVAARRLKNVCLSYLASLNTQEINTIVMDQYQSSDNMTDTMAVMTALNHTDCEERRQVLSDFYQRWSDDPLVVNKWLSLQAQSELPNTFEEVNALLEHEAFNLKNPNKVYALVGGFCSGNPVRFHDVTGKGYTWLTDLIIKLNELNPQVAARMINPLTQWRKFDEARQKLMQQALVKIQETKNLSKDLQEIVTKTLEFGQS